VVTIGHYLEVVYVLSIGTGLKTMRAQLV